MVKYSGVMSRMKPVLVSRMYWRRGCVRWGSVHIMVPCLSEDSPFSRGSWVLERSGHIRMEWATDSGSVRQHGQEVSGFTLHPEVWAAR